VIGPLHWKAALYERPAPPVAGQKGRPRTKGDRLPTPKAMIEDVTTYPAELQTVIFPQTTRELRLQVIRDVLWYRGCQTEPVVVLLVRDPLGQWRDEALVATDPSVSAAFILQGYCRRWSVELTFFDSKQYLGLHDPRVWSERSVERAHPRAWFVGTLTILVVRDRRSCRGARASGSGLVPSQSDSHVHGHVGRVTVADVAVRDLWLIWNGSALARNHRNPAPQDGRSGVGGPNACPK
jgi:hypothetical protein